MRNVTVCTSLGLRKVPGADHGEKFDLYQLQPGTAWSIHDDTRENQVIEVTERMSRSAKYTWGLRWIDGRTVAVFEVGGATLAQPVTEGPRAKERRSEKELRAPKHEAPGVAPETPAEPASAPPPTRRKSLIRKVNVLEPLD